MAAPSRIVALARHTMRRDDDRDGDFAHGHHKGRCADGEYAAGVASTGRIGSSRTPDALYCRELG
ncbi:hypothetical protein AB0A94_13610 [Streptomyces sp. NPDC044984]|uniref:hypothetical protein n=1 Tax=Streptomyces sp. NPDC044984 TaxID=3154335 RepID=UPI0033E958AB